VVIGESKVSIRSLVSDFCDDAERGARAYSGYLNIRPPYQREFIYNDDERDEVIRTIMKGYPLNVFYWAEEKDSNGGTIYELVDGQQRTVSICLYAMQQFEVALPGESVKKKLMQRSKAEQKQFLDYDIIVYRCSGTEEEKLAWFETINTAGEKLTKQELRNAVCTGTWLSDAKEYFSKPNCAAAGIGSKYMTGKPIRQEYLEEALRWIADRDKVDSIEAYMIAHRKDSNALLLWQYYRDVIDWVDRTFGAVYASDMRGIHWGLLYNKYKDKQLPDDLADQIDVLRSNRDITRKSGIYAYLLTGDEKHLNLRRFDDKIKRKVYDIQKGFCPHCGKHFEYTEMEADHKIPWSKGGKTEEVNCQMLCVQCNRSKGNKG